MPRISFNSAIWRYALFNNTYHAPYIRNCTIFFVLFVSWFSSSFTPSPSWIALIIFLNANQHLGLLYEIHISRKRPTFSILEAIHMRSWTARWVYFRFIHTAGYFFAIIGCSPIWHLGPELPADSDFLSLLRFSEFTQIFWVYSDFLSVFVLYCRLSDSNWSNLRLKISFFALERLKNHKVPHLQFYTLILQCSCH